MNKRTKSIEKESNQWHVKYDKCNRALLNMVSDKQAQDAYVAKSARQITQLQKLCRTLQAERTALIDVLTANNIERPVMPELPPAPTDIEPPPRSADKLDIMSRNCVELKRSLALLQGQMHALENKEVPKPPTSGKTTKSTNNGVSAAKKAKNKKAKSKSAPQKAENGAEETSVTTETPTEEIDASADVHIDVTTENDDNCSAIVDQPITNGNGSEATQSEAAATESDDHVAVTDITVAPEVEAPVAVDPVPAVVEALAAAAIVA